MKLRLLSERLPKMCAALSVAIAFTFTSCMPELKDTNGSAGGEEEKEELPEWVKQISLFSGYGGGSLAGLKFSDGFITSDNGWMLSSVGVVNGVTKVDYIPTINWYDRITPSIGQGFVGYNPKEKSFVSFFVAGLAVDEMSMTVGVGLMYVPSFVIDYAPAFGDGSVEFNASGATHVVKMSGTKYCEYQVSVDCDWLTATPKYSTLPFIYDEIELTAQPNTTGEPRTIDVEVISLHGKSTRITVTQKG